MLKEIKKKIQQAEVGEFWFQHEQNGIMVVVVGDKNPDGTVKLVDVSAYVTDDLEAEVNNLISKRYRGKMYRATGNLGAKAKITKQYAEGIYLFFKSELIKDKDVPSCINEYRKWKEENPDEDYQYDEIHDFANGLSRGELQELLEYADKR